MRRNKALIPLSHQHQHALALCVRVRRAADSGEPGLSLWQNEIEDQFERELLPHFEAEESILFPAAAAFPELLPLVHRLIADHTVLRGYNLAAVAQAMSRGDIRDFAEVLSAHVRSEETELFERCQQLFAPETLESVGQRLSDSLNETLSKAHTQAEGDLR